MSGALVIPEQFPVINLGVGIMNLPGLTSAVLLKGNFYERFLDEARSAKHPYIFSVMSRPGIDKAPERFYETGVLSELTVDPTDPIVHLLGKIRARASGWFKEKDGIWRVRLNIFQDDDEEYFTTSEGESVVGEQFSATLEGIFSKIRNLSHRLVEENDEIGHFDLGKFCSWLDDFDNYDRNSRQGIDRCVWELLGSLPEVKVVDKQMMIESRLLTERISYALNILARQIGIVKVAQRLDESLKEEMAGGKKSPAKSGKKSDKILDKADDPDDFIKGQHPDLVKMWQQFSQVRHSMNKDAEKCAFADFSKLKVIKNPDRSSSDWTKYITRLEFNIKLHAATESEQEKDITRTRNILDQDHHGLDDVKEEVVSNVAPIILNPDGKSPVLCMVGPPGVGKTSLGQSIARSLNRKFIRISFGGIHDEAAIRGHRVTYIGSEPGMILREIERCGSRNPVFMIDELDKLGGMSVSGDPSSAMLEVLDPEQNKNFKDHYLDASFDLSKVLFIGTANVEQNIPEPLRDRMNILRLHGYLEGDKVVIAKNFLIPRWSKELGLSSAERELLKVVWEDDVFAQMIRNYTDESGVRNLERGVAKILRKICQKILEARASGQELSEFRIDTAVVEEFLGPAKFFKDKARPTKIGEAIGLAWTRSGEGDILFVQVVTYPRPADKKVLSITGLQKEVMKEADYVALSLLRERAELYFGPEVSQKLRENISVHMHIPEGAVPKDGPSAGVTMFIATYSELAKKPVRPYLAMTGEITLKGDVLAVGGIREKVVAAEKSGMREIMLPKDNERNMRDIPKSVRDNLEFHLVSDLDEAIKVAF